MTHVWETWSDARAYDGSATILQPQALPLYGGFDAFELLAKFDNACSEWRARARAVDLAASSSKAISRITGRVRWRPGFVPDTASQEAKVRLNPEAAVISIPRPADVVSVLARPDPNLWDGRFAGNAWLQEVPRPFTQLTWDNPLLVAPALARRLGLENGEMVRVARGEAATNAAVWIMPGQAEDCLVAHLGGGRRHAGPVGMGVGFDFYPFVDAQGEVSLEKTGERRTIASTEHHNAIFDGSGVYARHATLVEFQSNDRLFAGDHSPRDTLYRWKPEGPAAWGMSVDLNACIGCNACVVACQAENNVPTVGKEEVLRRARDALAAHRSLLRGRGATTPTSICSRRCACIASRRLAKPSVPSGATVHDSEGLNVMVYNRCIGTRFCSNNCPYKVRRFNYFSFAQKERRAPQSRNPDVTVRARGVMEKCTFCLQRIAEAQDRRRSRQPAGWRRRDGLSGRLSDQGVHLRQSRKRGQRCRQTQAKPARLCAARRPEHASARDL